MIYDLDTIAQKFQFEGEILKIEAWGSGHINDTYRVDCRAEEEVCRYILQRINHEVFHDVIAVTENMKHVTQHIRTKLEAEGADDLDRKVLQLISTQGGELLFKGPDGNFWRAFRFIENAWSYNVVEKDEQPYEAAKAFGTFQRHLNDFPADQLQVTIPQFHDTRNRYDALLDALDKADTESCETAGEAIAFVKERESMVDVLLDLLSDGKLEEKATHNDTKLNNVMLDDETGEGLCVLDLDTVMPGLALYDFGDMVRSATNPATEDERDLTLVVFDIDRFELLVKGYLETAGSILSSLEIELLCFSAKLITLELGMRFLTDYLSGDTYFKTYRPGQNLDRARCQLAMLASMEQQEDDMRAVVNHYAG